MATFQNLDTPALLIEEPLLDANLGAMQGLAEDHNVRLRPHVKTHKMPVLAQNQLTLGAQGIAVSKISEAEAMAQAGINDIQVANELIGHPKLARLLKLHRQIDITCAVDSHAGASQISEYFEQNGAQAKVLVEIDSGLQRCGLAEHEAVLKLVQHLENLPGLEWHGIMTHGGHAYGARDLHQVANIGHQEAAKMDEVASMLHQAGHPPATVSVGATPTAPYCVKGRYINELRTGNYVFNDLTQVHLGVAGINECALSVLTTVISVNGQQAIVDAGSKTLTADKGAHGSDALQGFGRAMEGSGHMAKLSEEHGFLTQSRDAHLRVGDKVRIIPNHACAVANQFDVAYAIRDSEITNTYSIAARGCLQ